MFRNGGQGWHRWEQGYSILCGQVAWPPSTGCRKSVHLKEMLHLAAGALSGTSRCLAGWPQGKEPELRIWLLGFRVVWSLGRGKQFSGHFVGSTGAESS